MSIIKEQFFDYKSFFVTAFKRAYSAFPNDSIKDKSHSRESFLREYRTSIMNQGRMSGKTTGLLLLANELIASGYKVTVLTMNPANKRHVQNMVSYQYRDDIRIFTTGDLKYDPAQNKFDFLLIDESEFTIHNRHIRQEIYEWAVNRGVEFIAMT